MKKLVMTGMLALSLLGPVAYAAESESTPSVNSINRDYAAGKQAVDKKDWATAVASFRKVVVAQPNNADGYNMLGYSLRWMGKMDEAFAAYDRALQIDPKHKGALEYSGIAYLKANDPAKANAQLAKLETIAGKNSEEYRDLAKAISEYNASKQ
ncbi:MAG TPA: tetratricopeptide repeat protein [Burkholderiaceae bacterium]|nr:tetratricopeptide repeat protein [Burkholderiaceae bacterium]